MQIVYHIGAHCTDEGHILRCLAKNRVKLASEGIVIANPARFRPVLRETLSTLNGTAATPEAQQAMLDAIITEDDPARIIFSNDAFICNLRRILVDDTLYADAPEKVAKLCRLFPDHEIEFCLGIRNPATFIPACFAMTGAPNFEAYAAQVDALTLRWSDLIRRIQDTNPKATLTIWSNEDTPFIWHELIREITDHGENTTLEGMDNFMATIMSREGMDRMTNYLQTHPPTSEIQRRRVLSAFLDKFAIEEEVEIELDCPGWSEEFVETLTDLYEEDLYAIERIPGINFISP